MIIGFLHSCNCLDSRYETSDFHGYEDSCHGLLDYDTG